MSPDDPKPETQSGKNLVVGEVFTLTRPQYMVALEGWEKTAKRTLTHLNCSHSRNNLNMRMVILDSGITCLDCLMQDLNKNVPR